MLRCHRRQASVTSPLVEKNLRHHAFVLMAQQMTVKEGHAANDWIGEIHDQVHRAFGRHIYRVEPFRLRFWLIVCGVEQEMDLVNVEWMNLMCLIHDSPVLIRTHADTGHGRVLGTKSLAVNIETLFIFCEGDGKIGCGLF